MARDDTSVSRVHRMAGRGRDARTPFVLQLTVAGGVLIAVLLLVAVAYVAYWLA